MLYLYIYNVIQIVAESFPISSSGHVALFVQCATQLGYFQPLVTMTVWFNHVLHVPTVIITIIFFYHQWIRWRVMLFHPWRCKKIIMRLIGTVFIADAFTSCMYLFFKWYGTAFWHLGFGFFITMVVLYSLVMCMCHSVSTYHWYVVAGALGVVQSCALLPGISRFASTYVCARWCGKTAQAAFELSWLIQFPLIVAGSVHGVCGLYMSGLSAELLHPSMLFVILMATMIAWYALCMMYRMAIQERLYIVAYYMIVPLMIWILLNV